LSATYVPSVSLSIGCGGCTVLMQPGKMRHRERNIDKMILLLLFIIYSVTGGLKALYLRPAITPPLRAAAFNFRRRVRRG